MMAPETYRPVTIHDGLLAAAARQPTKIAIRSGERSLTYGALAHRIAAVQAGLVGSLSVVPGDRVAILAPNCLAYVELVAGIAATGAAAVTLNPRLTAPELQAILEDAEPRMLFIHEALAETGRALCEALQLPAPIVLGEAYEAWLSRARGTPPVQLVGETETFVVAYTSGTTGRPKGVALPHRSRVLTILGMAAEYGCFGPDDSALVVAPMFHGAGLAFALAPLYFGGSIEVLASFDPAFVLGRLASGELTNSFFVPTHFHGLFAAAEAAPNLRPARIKTIVSGAASLPQLAKEKAIELFGGHALHECFGSTEGGIVTNLRPADQLRKPKSVGLPFPLTRVRVIGLGGEALAPGEIGEIFSWSPYLFNGYWRKPKETAETLSDGWHSSGDLGRLDEDGFLFIEGRRKEMIISGGINVFPREIEEVLLLHPAVSECSIVGRPHADLGEETVAFVVRRPGMQVEAEELDELCLQHIARFKRPRVYRFLDELPKSSYGKILKTELRSLL